MQNLNFTPFIFITFLLASCNREDAKLNTTEIPDEVQTAFKANYSDVKNVSWEKDGSFYESEYDLNGKEQNVLYDSKGNVIRTESQISVSELPASVNNYINDKFAGYHIADAATIMKDGNSFYKVEIKNGKDESEYLFDMNGNYVSEDADDSGDEDDEEGDDE